MSLSGSASGGAVKRQREELVEEDAPSSLEMTVHPQPLMLLVLVKAYFDTLVWLQLCNSQGVALFSHIHLAPRVSRPFAGAAVYDMSLTHAERLRAVGSGLKGRLVRLLSLGMKCTTNSATPTTLTTSTTSASRSATQTSSITTTTSTRSTTTTTNVTTVIIATHQTRYFEPQRNWGACRKMMLSNVRRVAAGLAAAVRDQVAKEAEEELCASGQWAAAVVLLQRAIDWGDLPSRALMSWLLIPGKEGVAQDEERAFELAEEGARLGCHHCQGMLADCYMSGWGCELDEARSLELARESSSRGSKYGQVTLGWLHHYGLGGLAVDYAQAVAFYRLAAAQGLDEAQYKLGKMHRYGNGVAQDDVEALRWCQLAAAQGHYNAWVMVGDCHEYGCGVAADVAEAIRWYRRAHAVGHGDATYALRRLRACTQQQLPPPSHPLQ